jgi:glyoxylate/hydroxypyruvate reductase A
MQSTHKQKGKILVAISTPDGEEWAQVLATERPVILEPLDPKDPSIAFAVVWQHPPRLLSRLPNLRGIFSVGAGVDHILSDPSVPDVPIIRVVAEALTRSMTEYVVWRVLDHYRRGVDYRHNQYARAWRDLPVPVADQVCVGIMGLGELGRAAAAALLPFGFRINGWSRRPQAMPGVATYSGPEGLRPFLCTTDILVVLLPLTEATIGIIDYSLLTHLRRSNDLGGPVLINAGRGGLQKEADILRALEDGTLKEASLDVFEVEPLPALSTLWLHPRVFVTPHAAAPSYPRQLAPLMLAQMAALERGESLANTVNRSTGY